MQVQAAKSNDARRVSIDEIVRGSAPLPTSSGGKMHVEPLNLKGLRNLQKAYPQLVQGDDLDLGNAEDIVRIVTILVNQSRPAHDEATEDEIGRLIDASNIKQVVEAITECLRPFQEAVSATGTAINSGETSQSDTTGSPTI